MINENFVILGALFSFLGGLVYLIDTLKGRTKPHKITWFFWALAPLIAFAAEIKQGVGIVSLMTFMVGFNPLLIFLASFINKKSSWKISSFDILCGFFSLLGLILWYLTRIGNIAILFSIFSDALAAVPTLIKSYFHPKTENYKAYLGGLISAFITILTIKNWNFAHFGFPLYIFIINFLLVVLINLKKL